MTLPCHNLRHDVSIWKWAAVYQAVGPNADGKQCRSTFLAGAIPTYQERLKLKEAHRLPFTFQKARQRLECGRRRVRNVSTDTDGEVRERGRLHAFDFSCYFGFEMPFAVKAICYKRASLNICMSSLAWFNILLWFSAFFFFWMFHFQFLTTTNHWKCYAYIRLK